METHDAVQWERSVRDNKEGSSHCFGERETTRAKIAVYRVRPLFLRTMRSSTRLNELLRLMIEGGAIGAFNATFVYEFSESGLSVELARLKCSVLFTGWLKIPRYHSLFRPFVNCQLRGS